MTIPQKETLGERLDSLSSVLLVTLLERQADIHAGEFTGDILAAAARRLSGDVDVGAGSVIEVKDLDAYLDIVPAKSKGFRQLDGSLTFIPEILPDGRIRSRDGRVWLPDGSEDLKAAFYHARTQHSSGELHYIPWLGGYMNFAKMAIKPDTPVVVLRRDGVVDGPYAAGRIEWHHQGTRSDIFGWRTFRQVVNPIPDGIIPHIYSDSDPNWAQSSADQLMRQEITVDYYLDHMIDEVVYRWVSDDEAEAGMDPWRCYADLPYDADEIKERGWRLFVSLKIMPAWQ